MMRQPFYHLAALLLATACAAPPVSRLPALSTRALESSAGFVHEAMARQRVPGAALVVMKGEDVVLARGFGVESVERGDRVTPATVFPLNSISKQLVAALLLRLAEEGRLSIDDPAARHLPDFTRLPQGLTLRHLLTHTSGMREIFAQPALNAAIEKLGTPEEEFVAIARHSPADWSPGARWAYTNLNYVMLALVAERVAGESLEVALRARFFRPLGLSTMALCPSHPGGMPGAARGHVETKGALVPHPPENFHLFRGAGGFCGSSLDVARWIHALATGKVVNARSLAQMTAPDPLEAGGAADYGMGMVLVAPDGARRWGHGGNGGGFTTQAAHYPDADLTVVVAFNQQGFSEHAERRIVRRLLGLPELELQPRPLGPAERLRHAGSLDVGIRGWYPRLEERDGKLWFQAKPLPAIPMVHVGNGEFVHDGEPYGYRIYFGRDGSVRILGMGMMTWYGKRR